MKKLSRAARRFFAISSFTSVLFLVLPVVAAALFYVWTQITTVRLGYALSQASEAHRRLLEENRALRIEVAALKAPERLERLAAERFQLKAPRSEQIVRAEAAARGRASEPVGRLFPTQGGRR